MPVPSALSELSATISLNSPQGSESAKGTIDDYLRSHAGLIKQLYDALLGPSVTLASAATVAIGFASSANITITGTTNISAFDTAPEGTLRYITFTGALTIVHNASSMALPGAQNLGTSSADAAIFKSLGGGNWKCMFYQRANGAGPVFASASRDGSLSAADWSAFNGKQSGGVCLPLTGGVMTGPPVLANNVQLRANDTSGNARAIVSYGGDNNVNHVCGTGGNWNLYNSTGASVIFRVANNGDSLFTGKATVDTSNTGGQRGIQINNIAGNPEMAWVGASGSKALRLNGNTLEWINNAYSATIASLTDAGNFTALTVTETSDNRLKKLWRRLGPDLLQNVAALKKVGTFVWRKGGSAGMGGSAQEIEKFLPWAVHTDEHGFKSVRYGAAAFVIVAELTRAFFAHVAKTEKRLAKLERK